LDYDSTHQPNAKTKQYRLNQNYPNPFNESTIINFTILNADNVELSIYNVLGQKITTLIDNYLPKGKYAVSWDGTDAFGNKKPSGVYLYQLKGVYFKDVRKMLILK
jgi:flagellar hook assembly protein FlgD